MALLATRCKSLHSAFGHSAFGHSAFGHSAFHGPCFEGFASVASAVLRETDDGLQEHTESAAHGLSHESRPGDPRAAATREMAAQPALRADPGRPRRRGKEIRPS